MRAADSRGAIHRHSAALSPRAAFRRVFGGMAVFVSLPLLGLGGYLVKRQFEDPVESNPAGLLCAAVLIATALVLLSYVIYPGGGWSRAERTVLEDDVPPGPAIEISLCSPVTAPEEDSRADLVEHNR